MVELRDLFGLFAARQGAAGLLIMRFAGGALRETWQAHRAPENAAPFRRSMKGVGEDGESKVGGRHVDRWTCLLLLSFHRREPCLPRLCWAAEGMPYFLGDSGSAFSSSFRAGALSSPYLQTPGQTPIQCLKSTLAVAKVSQYASAACPVGKAAPIPVPCGIFPVVATELEAAARRMGLCAMGRKRKEGCFIAHRPPDGTPQPPFRRYSSDARVWYAQVTYSYVPAAASSSSSSSSSSSRFDISPIIT